MKSSSALDYDSPIGRLTLASDGDSLIGLWFEGQVRPDWPYLSSKQSYPAFDQAREWLDQYFAGKIPEAAPPLAPKGTDFQLKVWSRLREIAYGAVTTYSAIAKSLDPGKSMMARAVGGAVGRNPISIIIPCHRVIGANGSLTGFGGGLEVKKRLLSLEAGQGI
jgi:methylated-DNA-[protein]-cysteine S-methyltransferase